MDVDDETLDQNVSIPPWLVLPVPLTCPVISTGPESRSAPVNKSNA